MKNIQINQNVKATFQIINDLIANSNNIILVTHINPDGDAIGSALAMYIHCYGLGKNVNIVIDSPVPFNLKFLPFSDTIIEYNPKYKNLFSDADLIFVLDLNDSRRLRTFENEFNNSKAAKILIDHHISPTIIVDHSIVDVEATSTGELIYKYLTYNNDNTIDKNIADCLYTAILTDTGGFRYQRTDAEIFSIASELIDKGADPVNLYNEIYNRIPFKTMILLAEAMKGIELFCENKIAVMTITDDMFKSTDTTESDVEDFVDKTLTIDGTIVGILITEIKDRNETRISFRSKGDLSIRELATHFGGGGHINAAGARIYNSDFYEARKNIIEQARKIVS